MRREEEERDEVDRASLHIDSVSAAKSTTFSIREAGRRIKCTVFVESTSAGQSFPLVESSSS